MPNAGRVGLLTGTFDPVHRGHVAMAQAAMRACGLDEVWFLVNPEPGHKVRVTDFGDRVAMVRLAVAGEAGLREGAPGRTEPVRHRMVAFEQLMGAYPDREFVFIVGSDVLAAMPAWEDYAPAVERARFAVARRAGGEAAAPDQRLRAQVFELADHTAASSRVIQNELRAGQVPVELDDRVYDYIHERGLYAR